MLGTPAFMPPEQFTGALIDGRSDIFSLGVILYWLATGEQAFPGETVTAVSYKVVHTEPVPPRKLNPAVPGALERVILKCLTKDPSERYQTGEDLAHDLASIRAGRNQNELKTMVTVTDAPGSDSGMDVTLDSNALETPQASLTQKTEPAGQRPASTLQRKPKRRGGVPTIGIAAVFLIVVAVLGWYWHRRTVAVASTTTRPQDLSVPVAKLTSDNTNAAEIKAPPANPEPISETASAKSASSPPEHPSVRKAPATEKRSNTGTVPAGKAVAPPPAVPDTKPAVVAPSVEAPPPAPPARVNFNPLSLDPSANAKLRVEADHFPSNVDFTIEMNGKIYFERGANKTQTEFDNLFVPPGIQEFRFIAGSGTNRKISNTVSVEFKAKKRKTLRIEIREPVGTGVPQGVYPDSQLVAILK
jgi:serine/threonine-protein kinase